MKVKKVISGKIDEAYENIIRNNNDDSKRTLHNRKSPLYKNNIRNNNNFNSFNKSPGPLNNSRGNYYYTKVILIRLI